MFSPNWISDVYCKQPILPKNHIFSGIFPVVFSLQAWNANLQIPCLRRKLLTLHVRTLNISCIKNLISGVYCSGAILPKIDIFSGIFLVVFSLQAWNAYLQIPCFKNNIFRFLLLRGSFSYPLHPFALNICFLQIGYLMYIANSQYYPKTTYFQVYSQLYLVCRHEMQIFRFLVLGGSFWHCMWEHLIFLASKIWYLVYIAVGQYYPKSKYFQVYF